MDQLKNKELLRTQAIIGGQWVGAQTSVTFPVYNPASGKLLAKVPDMGALETTKAITSAHQALDGWRKLAAHERAGLLKVWFSLIVQHKEDLARILTLEQGKPIKEALGEVVYGASFIEWFAEEARRVYGDVIPGHSRDSRIITLKQPIGVVAALTPWNFPIAMITRKIAPALAVGCTVVVKPAADTPLSALAIAFLAEKAGFPPGVLNVITTSDPASVGEVLTSSPLVRKVSFTGSTEVGKLLMRQSASTVKKISLELGGNAPFIVLDDADIDAAVEGAIASKYRNAGQTCVCANRIFVQDAVYEPFLRKFTEQVSKLRIGDGTEPGIDIGPLISSEAVSKVEKLLADAIKKGAKVTLGGKTHSLGGNFYETTVVTEATPEMKFSQEEIFGPVAAIYRFSTDEEAIKLANDTPYGLASYFYGNNLKRVWKMAEALEYGMVGVNTGLISTAVAPFGGIKESGIGREGSRYGIDDYLEIKYICLGGI